jgi:hypothetical protein
MTTGTRQVAKVGRMHANRPLGTSPRSKSRKAKDEQQLERWGLLVAPRPAPRKPLAGWRKPVVVVLHTCAATFVADKLFVTDEGAPGRCLEILLWADCPDVPLQTFATASEITFPPGTQVVDSGSNGWDLWARMTAHGVLELPGGTDMSALRIGAASSGTQFSRPVERATLPEVREYRRIGATNIQVYDFESSFGSGRIVWAVTPNQTVAMSMSLQTDRESSAVAPAAVGWSSTPVGGAQTPPKR